MSGTLARGDALEELHRIKDASVDLVFTDPPYPSLEKHRALGTTTRLTGQWFDVVSWNYLEEVFRELYRILKKNSHCYVMGDWEATSEHYPGAAHAAGFRSWPPVVWDKISPGMGYHFRQRHEYISFFEKGKRQLNDNTSESIQSYRRERGYPTQKPVELVRVFVRQSSKPGDMVLDPFCGSGTTCIAAKLEERHYIGIDSSHHAMRTARERL